MLRHDWPFDKTDSPGSSSLVASKTGAPRYRSGEEAKRLQIVTWTIPPVSAMGGAGVAPVTVLHVPAVTENLRSLIPSRAFKQRLPPCLMVKVPLNGRLQAFFELFARFPF